MKLEWKKEQKEFYLPKAKPHLITVPSFKFFMISGKGDPNTSKEFSEAISVLYSLSYTIKMLPKKGIVPEGYLDYTVFPLEGVWDFAEGTEVFDKSNFIYNIMIRQPDFVTEELANYAISDAKEKKPYALLDEVKFAPLEDGLCVQMLHKGSFDSEPQSFAQMDEFCSENNLSRITKSHREIYLSNFNKTAPEKLKTVLRYRVNKIE